MSWSNSTVRRRKVLPGSQGEARLCRWILIFHGLVRRLPAPCHCWMESSFLFLAPSISVYLNNVIKNDLQEILLFVWMVLQPDLSDVSLNCLCQSSSTPRPEVGLAEAMKGARMGAGRPKLRTQAFECFLQISYLCKPPRRQLATPI